MSRIASLRFIAPMVAVATFASAQSATALTKDQAVANCRVKATPQVIALHAGGQRAA